MSFLSKLNPLSWIKDLLFSNYVGGFIRHGLTWFGGMMVSIGWATPEHMEGVTGSLGDWLLSPEFMGGVMTVIGVVASVKNKKDK